MASSHPRHTIQHFVSIIQFVISSLFVGDQCTRFILKQIVRQVAAEPWEGWCKPVTRGSQSCM